MTVPDPIAAAAEHGAWCPKMCTFACPVAQATGRDDAVPWSFHRTVADLAAGHLPVTAGVAGRLEACTGCLGCQSACAFGQDVPAQVRAGRAALTAAGVQPPAVDQAVAAVQAGRSAYGVDRPVASPGDHDPTVALLLGCRDGTPVADAALRLLRSAGERVVAVAPSGCCGALLDDLGAVEAATAARTSLAVPEGPAVVASDPHCLPALQQATPAARHIVSHLDDLLAAGRLRLTGPPTAVIWHDPCLLARRDGVTDAPRRLLAAAGYEVVEPEHTRGDTACSGGGMGMDLLAPSAAAATARRRATELGRGPALTACAGARRRLSDAGAEVADLLVALADRLDHG